MVSGSPHTSQTVHCLQPAKPTAGKIYSPHNEFEFMTQPDALGLLETTGLTPALAALDAMEKAAPIELIQAELNDFYGIILKISGNIAAVEEAVAAGREVAERLGGKPIAQVIRRTDPEAWKGIQSRVEYNPLIQQNVVIVPATYEDIRPVSQESPVNETQSFALGLIETQGFTAVFQAIDTACKAANVEVIGKEKLGGGYITIVVKGDVAAVNAAIEAGREKVEGLGKLIAAHVIADLAKPC